MSSFKYKTATLEEVVEKFKTSKIKTISHMICKFKKSDFVVYEKLIQARAITHPEIQGDGRFVEKTTIEIGQKFGKDSQVEVIENMGKIKGELFYKVVCHKCKINTRIYGDGTFLIRKSGLTSGKLPCGCPRSSKKKTDQRIILCEEVANNKGITILGIEEDNKTLSLRCNRDGSSWKQNWSQFRKFGGCRKCNMEMSPNRKDNDDEVAKKFMDTGYFHDQTIFWRSAKREANIDFWHYICPVCSKDDTSSPEIFEGRRGELLKGNLACFCNPFRKRENLSVYVLDVKSKNSQEGFTGYGVTFNLQKRLYLHKINLNKAGFNISDSKVFEITESKGREIERLIKRNFPVNRKEIEGFRTEATFQDEYLSVINFVSSEISKYSNSENEVLDSMPAKQH